MTDFSKDARIFKALCDQKRLAILDCLKGGETCACVLIEKMHIGQSALSYHMKILCDSGIVTARQEGKWTHYSLSVSGRNYASKRLLELTTPNSEIQAKCCK
ncbi:MAG: metalloregulator ArsR/SmtB family transcription factor [Lachnospiraceae bacterium]|nr:metalloregulator ArsR/SmtB family transcription factor [Lachnospiraceae bacterium]